MKFALPIAFAILIPQINFFTNNYFLGKLGETELGLAGITGVYYLVFAVIGNGFNNGLQSILSRFAGAENRMQLGRYVSQALKLVLITALLGILFTYSIAPAMFRHEIQNHHALDLALKFNLIRILGLPFLYMYQIGNSFLISTNHTRFLVIGTLAEAATNIFLDYTLIFGHFGATALGFTGAAYASIGAEIMGMIVVHAFLFFKGITTDYKVFSHIKWDSKAALQLLDRSAPLIFQYFISVGSWLLFYFWVGHLGTRSMAISNTMRNVFGLFGIIGWAMASTTNNMVSNLIGQDRKEEVMDLVKRVCTINFMYAVLFIIVLNFRPAFYFHFFDQDPGFIQDGIPSLHMVSLALLFMSQGVVWLNALSGTGQTRINLLIEFICVTIYIIYVYLAVMVYRMPLVYAWGSEILYWSIMLGGAIFYFRFFDWKARIKEVQ